MPIRLAGYLLVMCVCCWLLQPASTHAQIVDLERRIAALRIELERTDVLIGRAREAAEGSDNPVSRRLVERATNLQSQAWQQFELRTDLSLMAAHRLTRQAREAARSALNQSRNSEQFEGALQHRLERAEEVLQRAEATNDLRGRPAMRSLLESANSNLSRAWEFFRQKDYRPALKLAEQVERAAEKLIQAGHVEERAEHQYERRRDAVLQLLDDVREYIVECQEGRSFFEQAEETVRKSSEFHLNGRTRAALQSLQQARELALQAQRHCQGHGQLEQRLVSLQHEAQKLSEHVNGLVDHPQADAARKLVAQALDQLESARGYLARKRVSETVISLKAAQLALRQAQEYIGTGQ